MPRRYNGATVPVVRRPVLHTYHTWQLYTRHCRCAVRVGVCRAACRTRANSPSVTRVAVGCNRHGRAQPPTQRWLRYPHPVCARAPMSSSVHTAVAPSFGGGSGGGGKRGRDGDDGRDRRRPERPKPTDKISVVDFGPEGRIRQLILLLLQVANLGTLPSGSPRESCRRATLSWQRASCMCYAPSMPPASSISLSPCWWNYSPHAPWSSAHASTTTTTTDAQCHCDLQQEERRISRH